MKAAPADPAALVNLSWLARQLPQFGQRLHQAILARS
jgi:hypothetical protein